jgi:hypothetical protein
LCAEVHILDETILQFCAGAAEDESKNKQAGERMQQLYPEGFVFIHATVFLYCLQ